VEDKDTGKPASIFYVVVVRWHSDSRVEVSAGRYGGLLDGAGFGAIVETEFDTGDLEKLRDSLERSTDAFIKPPKSLPIPEHLGYGSTVFSPDPKIMMPIVKRTLTMIQYALANNGTLVFRGD
jgi:hypothetical protein